LERSNLLKLSVKKQGHSSKNSLNSKEMADYLCKYLITAEITAFIKPLQINSMKS